MASHPPNSRFPQSINISSLLEGAPEPLDFPPIEKVPPTDFGAFVLDAISRMTILDSDDNGDGEEQKGDKEPPISRTIDQSILCQCLRLSSSFLITDASMNPERGTHTWAIGLSRLIDIVIALHNRSELELATIVAATKACRECWIAAGAFTAVEECRGKWRQNI
ncbi:hypothetical protein BKA70DRAFT_1216971 [Coprinopsis sp. MPI-PUGE-AT-0042]|nr:hypothetical protein BKA70DRAFT_1216971 [Coprinopsis sp. MPI-PUGE-AT-0042]